MKRFKPSSKTQGQDAEQHAQRYLERAGLSCLRRNFSCRMGEIDLIMKTPEGVLVFVEVRLRTHRQYASALESVTRQKQIKLIKASQFFLMQYPNEGHEGIRFDVVGLDGPTTKLTWVQGAFEDFT